MELLSGRLRANLTNCNVNDWKLHPGCDALTTEQEKNYILQRDTGNKPRTDTCSLLSKCCSSKKGLLLVFSTFLGTANRPNKRSPVSLLQKGPSLLQDKSWCICMTSRLTYVCKCAFAEPASSVLQCALAGKSHALTGRQQTLYLVAATHSSTCADGWRQGDDVTSRRQMCFIPDLAGLSGPVSPSLNYSLSCNKDWWKTCDMDRQQLGKLMI